MSLFCIVLISRPYVDTRIMSSILNVLTSILIGYIFLVVWMHYPSVSAYLPHELGTEIEVVPIDFFRFKTAPDTTHKLTNRAGEAEYLFSFFSLSDLLLSPQFLLCRLNF